jgi:hypothetical protein
MVRIIETGNVITCPECDRNLSCKEDDVFFNKITSCGHRNYYNKCVMCPYCKNKVVVSGDAVFVELIDIETLKREIANDKKTITILNDSNVWRGNEQRDRKQAENRA